MDQIEISSFGHEVIAAGSVVGSVDHPTTLVIDPKDQNDNKLVVNISFEEDDSKQGSSHFSGTGNELNVKLVNYNNPIGDGFSKPVDIAVNKNSILSLELMVHSLQHLRLISYTILRRKKDAVSESGRDGK